MTNHPIITLSDGTRVYSNGYRYKPVPDEQRKYRKRKPPVPGALLYNREWVLPLDEMVIPEEWREPMPETRPDTDAYEHWLTKRWCKCDVCRRPEAKRWKLRGRRERRAQMRRAESSPVSS